MAAERRLDFDVGANRRVRAGFLIRGPLGGDEAFAAHAVAHLVAGKVVEQAEVEFVPRAFVRQRYICGTRTRLARDRHPHEHEQAEDHGEDDDQRDHATSSMLRAIVVSRSVKPPASCDVRATRTVRQRMSRSGWWSAFSARKPMRTTNATASGNDARS